MYRAKAVNLDNKRMQYASQPYCYACVTRITATRSNSANTTVLLLGRLDSLLFLSLVPIPWSLQSSSRHVWVNQLPKVVVRSKVNTSNFISSTLSRWNLKWCHMPEDAGQKLVDELANSWEAEIVGQENFSDRWAMIASVYWHMRVCEQLDCRRRPIKDSMLLAKQCVHSHTENVALSLYQAIPYALGAAILLLQHDTTSSIMNRVPHECKFQGTLG